MAALYLVSGFFPAFVYFITSITAYIFIALSGKSLYDAYQDEEKKRLKKEKEDLEEETITTMDNTKANKIKLEKNKTKNDKLLEKEEKEHDKLSKKLKFRENWFKGSLIAYGISIAGVILFSPYFLAGITVSAVSAIGMAKEIKTNKEQEQKSLGIINTTKRLNALIEEKVDSIKKVLTSPVEEVKEKEPTSKAKTEDKTKTPTTSEFIPLEGYFGPPEMGSGKVKKIGTR